GWGLYLDRFGRRCFSVKQSVSGREAVTGGGPLIVFLRHASVADNLLGPVFFGVEGGLSVRYVAKFELSNDPIFDLTGTRLVSVFVRRASGDSEREIKAVTALLDEDFGKGDVIVVWPEGTRFSESKRQRILESIERRGDPAKLARAKALKHVL